MSGTVEMHLYYSNVRYLRSSRVYYSGLAKYRRAILGLDFCPMVAEINRICRLVLRERTERVSLAGFRSPYLALVILVCSVLYRHWSVNDDSGAAIHGSGSGLFASVKSLIICCNFRTKPDRDCHKVRTL